jgi:predicted phosphodiesterase
MTRRDFLTAGVGAAFIPRWMPLRLNEPPPKPLKIAVIADIHHGLAPDAMSRLEAFVERALKRKDLDLAIQMGDFCYSQPDSAPFLKLWNRLPMPKLHVLGNHDMDKCDKAAAMSMWGMKRRYGAYEFGGYRFVVLDLNHYKKNGKLEAYANGNYFTDNATHNWADPEQLEWLAAELRRSKKPVIVLSHQPLGFAAAGKPLGAEQVEVLKVITEAAKDNPKGAVAACLCGHMHIDRLEMHEGIPCYCVNSASYFWHGGMQPYTKPLFAFIEIADGRMAIEGVAGEFVKPPPAASDSVPGRSASIESRRIVLPGVGRSLMSSRG